MIEFELVKPVDAHLSEKAQALGDKAAFQDKSAAVSYAELDRRTSGLAAGLAGLGVSPGDRVAILLPNSVAWVETCLAIVRRGAVAVPISYDASPDEIAYRLEDAGCTAAFTTAEKRERVASVHATIATDEEYAGLLRAEPRPETCESLDIDQPAFILYTSGTTGRAKGVVLTQRSMLWVVAACWRPIAGLGEGDVMLAPLPLFHSYGLDLVVLGTLACGATARIMERFSTDEALSLLRSGAYTVFPAVPTMFHYLLERAGENGAGEFGGLRVCISAGAIMPGTLNMKFEERFGVPLVDGYGITETSTMVTLNWPGRPRIMGSCGLPVPGLAVRIVDPTSREDVPPGGEGELIVRGPNLMLRYHDKPEETGRALSGGWYLTGDLARSDANGFLTITGRLKEIIIRGGQNIAPAEIEEVVVQHPSVLDCAVVGARHAALGEVPVLFVVPRAGAAVDEAEIRAFCGQHLSRYKCPEAVHVIEAIPRTGSGKIKRFELQKLLAGAV